MAGAKKILKLLFFGIILLVLSAGYRIFGEKQKGSEKTGPLSWGSEEARADVPSCSCSCGEGGSSTGEGSDS